MSWMFCNAFIGMDYLIFMQIFVVIIITAIIALPYKRVLQEIWRINLNTNDVLHLVFFVKAIFLHVVLLYKLNMCFI